MKYRYLTFAILFVTQILTGQEKWGVYQGSIAGTHFVVIEACKDSVEVPATGLKYEVLHQNQFGFIYSDVGHRKEGSRVYAKYLNSDFPEELLYDFDVEIGDTIDGMWGNFEVVDVSKVDVFGESRTQVKIEEVLYGYEDVWVEGVGSIIRGYLQPGTPPLIIDGGSDFSCYYNAEFGAFYLSENEDFVCQIELDSTLCPPLSSIEHNELEAQINIYPNPTDGQLNIDLERKFSSDIQVKVYNLAGSCVLDESFKSHEIKLDLANVMSGMYLVQLYGDGFSYANRIVIE